MNSYIKKEWCEALRSGKYHQIFGDFEGIDRWSGEKGYCVLGLLQKIGDKDYSIEDYLTGDEIYKLSKMNDDGLNFVQLADYIEKNL